MVGAIVGVSPETASVLSQSLTAGGGGKGESCRV